MPDVPMTMGIETEYGITCTEDDNIFSCESMPYLVVRAIQELNTALVDRGLEQVEDVDEHERAEINSMNLEFFMETDIMKRWEKISSSAALRQRFAYSGFVLVNGARYYVDMGHPEYSTPETQDPRTVVLAQKAGDWIVEQCRANAENSWRQRHHDPNFALQIYRNNCDTKGHSWAAHENYLLTPSLFRQIIEPIPSRRFADWTYYLTDITHAVLKFFVTRQIITGAGKVGCDETDRSKAYQISQRADFMVCPIGNSTTILRGIINTRNHPLSNYDMFRRLHVICGDSNMSELSIYLKCGITALFLKMLEYGYIQSAPGNLMMPLADSVESMHAVSRDLTLRENIALHNGKSTTALDTQIQFCERAKSFVDVMQLEPVWRDVVEKWEAALNGLNGNRFADPWTRSLDWVIKEPLQQQLKRRNPSIENLMAFDLAYHDVNRQDSIYDRVVARGKIMRMVSDEEILQMTHEPPDDSRAWLRGTLVKRYPDDVIDIGWDYAFFADGTFLTMDDPYRGTRVQIEPLLADNPSCDVFLARIKPLVKNEQVKIPRLFQGRRHSDRPRQKERETGHLFPRQKNIPPELLEF